MGWMRTAGAAALLATLGACTTQSEVEPLEGLGRIEMHEMATEAYALWDPSSLQLQRIELVRGHRVDAGRYDLDIRYSVLKVAEPTLTTHAAEAEQAARSPDPATAALAPQLRRLAALKIGESAEFTDTIVLVPFHGSWVPKPWRDREASLAQGARVRPAAPGVTRSGRPAR
ncbi:hypothetical protein [Lysobacter xanthus]